MTVLDRVIEFAEERLNLAVLPATEAVGLRESADRLEQFREEASDLAWNSLDYFGGRPQEWRPERRIRLAQRARIALQGDPLAGAEAEHYANFTLSRGISIPQAADPDVQKVVNAAWTDQANVEVLTGYDAQRALSNELKAGSNVFFTAYAGGGRVRVGFLEADTIKDIVPDPEARWRPMWYVGTKRRLVWDFKEHRPKTLDQVRDGLPQVVYYPHWFNVEEIRREIRDGTRSEIDWPNEKDVGDGLVYHVRVNRLQEQMFGVPVWARTLRFYNAMNRFTEARVAMAQASASFIAKRVMHGGAKGILQTAQSILRQTGEIGTRPSGEFDEEGRQSGPWGTGNSPPRPGSFLQENESHRLESLSLNSGAAAALQDAQIIRGAATAASAMGQHMYGDASNTNLATASSLELPAMMGIGAWGEVLEQVYRWFTNMAIQAAVRAGKLGGTLPPEERTGQLAALSLEDLNLFEAEQAEEAEARTGKDLSYTFQMPYPGRRNLPDVVNAFTAVLAQVDPQAENEVLLKVLLDFLLRNGIEAEDPPALANAIWERQKLLIEERRKQAALLAAAGAAPPAAAGGAPNRGGGRPVTRSPRPSGDETGGGVRRRGTTADPKRMRALAAALREVGYEDLAEEVETEALEEQMWIPDDLRDLASTLADDASRILARAVTEPGVLAATLNPHAPAPNGDGPYSTP